MFAIGAEVTRVSIGVKPCRRSTAKAIAGQCAGAPRFKLAGHSRPRACPGRYRSPAIRRHHSRLLENIRQIRMQHQINAAHNGHIAFVVEQSVPRLM